MIGYRIWAIVVLLGIGLVDPVLAKAAGSRAGMVEWSGQEKLLSPSVSRGFSQTPPNRLDTSEIVDLSDPSWRAVSDFQNGIVKFYLRNNRGWFRSVTIISYPPQSSEGRVESRTLIPLQKMAISLPVGTKIYIATQDQIQLFNEGKDIRNFPPSLTVRPDDAEKEYPIFH